MSRRFGTRPMPCMLLFLAFAACGRESEPLENPLVRDSAGVRIVENRVAPESLPTWTVSAEPLTVFGGEEGLYRVSGAVRLDDGRVAIAHAGGHEILLHGADGERLWSFGREGEGPGEFVDLEQVWRDGPNTLAAWDRALQRLTRVDDDGALIEVISFERSAYPSPAFVGPIGDRGYLLVAFSFPTGEDGVTRRVLTFVRYSPGGRPVGEVGTYPSMRMHATNGGMMGEAFSPLPTAATHDDGFWIGPATSEEVLGFDSDEELRTIVRWPAEDRTVRPEHVEPLVEEHSAVMPPPPGRPEWRAEDIHHAERFPAYLRVKVDREERLWVQRYPRPGEEGPRRWAIFEDGVLVARASVPADFHPREIGTDQVLGVHRDEMDVERVELRALVREITGNRTPTGG